MTTLISDSLNFKTGTVLHPTYQYTKQYPQESLGNYTVTNAQGPINTFQLIPNTMNLSKCKLCFTIFIPAQGANNFTWLNVNGLKTFTRITVQPQGGPVIMDVNFIDRYMDIVARRTSELEDVLTWDAAQPYAVAGAGNGTFYEGLIPSNFPNAQIIRLDNSPTAKDSESEYVMVSTAANTGMYLDVKIPFDKFVDTILGVNHDLFWKGDNLTITFYYTPLSNYCWLGTANNNPSTGAAVPVVNATIMNPYMLVAIQQNPELCKSIMEKCTSQAGLTFKTPYVYEWSQSISQGGNNLQTYYNSGQGSHVKKIYWATYPTTPASPNLVYDKNNVNGTKITQFQTQVNGINVQQFPYVPTQGDDFLYLRDKLRKTDILSFNEYLYNWVWVENFTENRGKVFKELFPDVPCDNLIDGLPLISPCQYNITATSAANLTNFLFTVFLREIRIAKDNITII